MKVVQAKQVETVSKSGEVVVSQPQYWIEDNNGQRIKNKIGGYRYFKTERAARAAIRKIEEAAAAAACGCGFQFDVERLGKYGCLNCEGEQRAA